MSQCFTKMCTDPRNVESDYSNDVQGICNDGVYWYISHGAGTKKYDRNYGAIHRVDWNRIGKKSSAKKEVKVNDCIVYNRGRQENRRCYKYYTSDGEPVGLKVGEMHFGDIDCKPRHVAHKLLRRRRLALAVLRLEGKFRFQVARPELLGHGKTDDELHAPGRGNVAVRR